MKERYWVGVVSHSHVKKGVSGGFAQLCHGKCAPLKRMSIGDWLIYYSPKTDMDQGEPLQMFTAVGQVTGESTYQYEMAPDFVPYRRDIKYVDCKVAPIKPLLAGCHLYETLSAGDIRLKLGSLKYQKMISK